MELHGLLLRRSDGTWETEEEHDRRLLHNQRMRFNRSFESALAQKYTSSNLLSHLHGPIYATYLMIQLALTCRAHP